MQSPSINRELTADSLPLEGAACRSTRRVVVVSPFPQYLQELIAALAARCYDVMVFHHAEPELPLKLQADAVIVDRTAAYADADALQELESLAGILTVIPYANTDPVEKVMIRLEQAGPAANKDNSSSLLAWRDLVVDTKRIIVKKGEADIPLTKTEFDLLKALMEAEGAVLSRQELMDQVWGTHYYGGSNTVDVHIKSLRQKLGDDPKSPLYIVTVRGIGYRLS